MGTERSWSPAPGSSRARWSQPWPWCLPGRCAPSGPIALWAPSSWDPGSPAIGRWRRARAW